VAEKVKISSKYQIVIPKEVREDLHLKAGDKLMVETIEGNRLILWKPPKDYAEYMAGLHKEIWKGINIDEYIKNLRRGWSKRRIWGKKRI
jgi:AbrB family looped-hinge helix DNA binding protein